jgi:hypothetical protein
MEQVEAGEAGTNHDHIEIRLVAVALDRHALSPFTSP